MNESNEGLTAQPVGAGGAPARGSVRGRKRAALAVATVIIAGAFGFLLWGGIGENVVFFYTPQELLQKGAAVYDASVRLGGQVEPGSVKWDANRLDLQFVVTDGAKTIPVRSTGAPPQMFRDGMGVIVEGKFRRDGVFESTNLMVKHSNEYRAPKEGEHPKDLYKSLVKEPTT
ncbi:MAG TPA: cytochrome c maturation protein CcmE [Gemmatimonadaceae bacterium]|nr:cytochrome c maturation protein CcmE [Gemmatimonadaceae bacterium]